MMQTVNIHAAKTNLSKLLDAVAQGEEVVIARAGRPVARLVPVETTAPKPSRKLGILNGKYTVPPDFDADLPNDILDMFEGR